MRWMGLYLIRHGSSAMNMVAVVTGFRKAFVGSNLALGRLALGRLAL